AWRDTPWSRGLRPVRQALCSTVSRELIAACWRPQQSDWHPPRSPLRRPNQPDARPHNTLEHAPENVAVAEPFIAGPRKRRVIRDLVLNREPTKPAIGEVSRAHHGTALAPSGSQTRSRR